MMALLPLVLARWRLLAVLAAVAAISLASAWATHRLEAPARARLQAQLAAARAQAGAAEASAQVQTRAAAAVETARTTEAHVSTRTGALADALSHAPAGDAAVAPDVLRDWAAAVDGLRDDARTAHAATPGPGGAGAARAVPTP